MNVLSEKGSWKIVLKEMFKRFFRKYIESIINQKLHMYWMSIPPGQYYSTIPSVDDINESKASGLDDCLYGLDLKEDDQKILYSELNKIAKHQAKAWKSVRFNPDNVFFSGIDAEVYAALLSYLGPQRVVEIGSGYSTALLLDWADQNHFVNLICVEPYPDRLKSLLSTEDMKKIQLIEDRVQDVNMKLFEGLKAGDLLFVDSSHVAKHNSDVLYLFTQVIPRLPAGVIVHFHDIFWPFDYPKDWMMRGWYWTEAYLLRAFLTHNNRDQIFFFSDYILRKPECQKFLNQAWLGSNRNPSSLYIKTGSGL